MPVESVYDFIDDLNPIWPNDNPDQLAQQATHSRGIKNALQGSFPSLGQNAVTRTAAEINAFIDANSLDTLTNKTIDNGAYTGVQTGFAGDINGNVTGNVTGDVNGNVTGNVSGTAGSITGQGALATLNSVGAAQINANAVGTSELKTNATTGSIVKNVSGSELVPDGWYMFEGTGGGVIETDVGAGFGAINAVGEGAMCWSDGTNTRVRNTTGASMTFRYRKLS